MKQYKLLVEFVRDEATELWAIDVSESVDLMKQIAKLAESKWYQAFIKWTPREDDEWGDHRKWYYDLLRVFRHATIFWAVTYFSKEMWAYRVEKIEIKKWHTADKIFYDEIW